METFCTASSSSHTFPIISFLHFSGISRPALDLPSIPSTSIVNLEHRSLGLRLPSDSYKPAVGLLLKASLLLLKREANTCFPHRKLCSPVGSESSVVSNVMNSSSESYDEEGEIFETEVEKAPPSLPSVPGPSVDRLSNRNRGSRSPAISHNSDDARSTLSRHDRRDQDYQYRDCDYPRGEKRRRGDSRGDRGPDPRQHRVHYETGGDPNYGRRPRVSYADIDRSDTREFPRQPYENQDDRYCRELKRSRTRSRSPPRGPRGDAGRGDNGRGGRGRGRGYYDDNRRENGNRYHERDTARHDESRKHSQEQSVSEQGDFSESSKRDAENRSKVSDRTPSAVQKMTNGRSVALSKRVSFSLEVDFLDYDRNVPIEKGPLKRAHEEPEIEEPVDEARLIEERRKKREAIKAKYRGQATPLLVSALGLSDSAPNSPAESIATPGELNDIPIALCGCL